MQSFDNLKESNVIRIATYNLRNTQDQYNLRKELLKTTINSVDAQIMGLQEVAFKELDNLIDKKYNFYNCQTQIKFHQLRHPDPEALIDGNSIIYQNIKLQDHQILHISHVRAAHRVTYQIGDSNNKIYIFNTHLHHTIQDSLIRQHQIQSILDWIQILEEQNQNFILLGDFNFNPQSEEYSIISKAGFISSYKQVNGQEPELTFPTGLTGPNMDTDPPGTFDYIWYKGTRLNPIESKLFGEKRHPQIDGIYASDHMGVVTTFMINQ